MFLRGFLIWALIAACEVIHGVLRVKFLNRRVGDHRARQIGVGTGAALNFFLTWLTWPWLGAGTTGELLGVGALWLVLMLAFEVGFGRIGFHFSWPRIAKDFDPRRGGWLGLGMLLLFLSPWVAAWLRGSG